MNLLYLLYLQFVVQLRHSYTKQLTHHNCELLITVSENRQSATKQAQALLTLTLSTARAINPHQGHGEHENFRWISALRHKRRVKIDTVSHPCSGNGVLVSACD